MRIRKRSVPLPISYLCPTIPPDPLLHKVPSSEEQLEPDRKAGREGGEEEQQKETKANGSKPQQPNGGDPSSVALKQVGRTHLDHEHQPQTKTSSNPSPPLLLKLEENRDRPSSDLQLTIIRVNDGWICLDNVGGGGVEEQKTAKYESRCMCPNTPSQAENGLQGEEEKTKGKRWRVLINNSTSRNASGLGAEAGDEIGANGLLSSSSNKVGRWCEGEKAFPLKKRRGSFDSKASGETTTWGKEKKMRTILKTKTNKKFMQPEDDDEDDKNEEEGKEGLRNNGSSSKSVKKIG